MLKQLNSFIMSDTFSWLDGREVTYQIVVPEVTGSISRSYMDFYVVFLIDVVLIVHVWSIKRNFSEHVAKT